MAKWNLTDLEREISDLREQLRKAQERIRAAEAERDRSWNEAIEAAARRCDGEVGEWEAGRALAVTTQTAEIMRAMRDVSSKLARAIRSLAKEAGE